MSESTETVSTGGGAATPLGEDFIALLSGLIGGSQAGGVQPASPDQPTSISKRGLTIERTGATDRFAQTDPIERTDQVSQAIERLLSGNVGSNLEGNITELVGQQTRDQIDATRARFGASGGTSLGTPAAVAESNVTARQGPALAAALGQLDLSRAGIQLNTLQSLLQALAGLSGRGIPQAAENIVVKPNPFISFLGAAGGAAQGAGQIAQAI